MQTKNAKKKTPSFRKQIDLLIFANFKNKIYMFIRLIMTIINMKKYSYYFN